MLTDEHKMSEESQSNDFKSLRITLSQEAFDRMETIMKTAKFRSYSSTVEECLRTTYDIMEDVYLLAGERDAEVIVYPTAQDCLEVLKKIIIRMYRITGRTVLTSEQVKRGKTQ